jgi:hypothetical protein
MEPVDLYMCKQTCTALAHIDRGHPLRDTSLSMVGKQYEMYGICAICHEEVDKNYGNRFYGMYIHEICEDKLCVTSYRSENNKWVPCLEEPAQPGTYKLVFEPWNHAMWDFQDNAIVGHEIDLATNINVFQNSCVEEYLDAHYDRQVFDFYVWDSFKEEKRALGSSLSETLEILDKYAEELSKRMHNVEKLLQKHSLVQNPSFEKFLDRYMRWYPNPEESFTLKKIREYDLNEIQSMVSSVKKEILREYRRGGDCKWCRQYFRATELEFLDESPKVCELIHEGGNISKGLQSFRKYLEKFFSCASAIIHSSKFKTTTKIGIFNDCFWSLYLGEFTFSTTGIHKKMKKYIANK